MDAEDRPVVGTTMLAHALFHGYELAIPVFVVVWLDVFPVSEGVLGVIVGAGYAAIGIGAVPSGVLADIYGSDRILVAALVGMGAGFLLVSVSTNVVVLAIALVLWGTAASVYHPAGLSLLSRATTERGTAFAYHGAAGNVGTVVGPLATAVLLSVLDWRAVAAVLVVPAFGGAVLAAHLSPNSSSRHLGGPPRGKRGAEGVASIRASTRTLFSGGFVIIFGIVLLYGLYYRGVLTFLPAILRDVTALDSVSLSGQSVSIGEYVYAGLLAIGVFGQYAGGRTTEVVRSEVVLVVAFVLLVVVALAFVPAAGVGVLPLLVVCAIMGFTIYVIAPVYQVTIAEYVTSDIHGLTYGYTYFAMFGVGALGASVAGATLAYASTTTLFVILGGLATTAAVVSGALLRR